MYLWFSFGFSSLALLCFNVSENKPVRMVIVCVGVGINGCFITLNLNYQCLNTGCWQRVPWIQAGDRSCRGSRLTEIVVDPHL